MIKYASRSMYDFYYFDILYAFFLIKDVPLKRLYARYFITRNEYL